MNLSTEYLSLSFLNPFVLASAPPTAGYEMIARAFEAGWAGAVIKTLTREPVKNLQNRFASNRAGSHIIAFENIELVSERSPEDWFLDIRKIKESFPDRRVIGSIMGDARSASLWIELALGCQQAGADLLELNFSCPHGYPEKGRGSAIGQHALYVQLIVQWLKDESALTIPLIPKLTAAVADICSIGEAAASAQADGLCAINTFPSLMGFDLKTLHPRASVGGYSTAGGYSGPGLKPIALRCVSDLVKNPGLPVMACGGVSSGYDAAECILLGAPLVQVCTAVMLRGYGIVEQMMEDLREFMSWHQFPDIAGFLGTGNPLILPYSQLDPACTVTAVIDRKRCTGCGACLISCRDGGYQAITVSDRQARVDPKACQGCSLCFQVCPVGAITMKQVQ